MEATHTIRDRINLLKDIIRNPYAWPGGYDRLAITSDGGVLCAECLKAEYRSVLHSTKYEYSDGWEVYGSALGCNYDVIMCDHCYKVYGVAADDADGGE